jgi:hypothetical protein
VGLSGRRSEPLHMYLQVLLSLMLTLSLPEQRGLDPTFSPERMPVVQEDSHLPRCSFCLSGVVVVCGVQPSLQLYKPIIKLVPGTTRVRARLAGRWRPEIAHKHCNGTTFDP